MAESLISVGLDVGTTSTQVIFSELAVENKAGSFSVPEMEIARRQVLYRGQVRFTPLKGNDLVDAAALGRMVQEEYDRAGYRREDVDTGAIIITGETSRKENARAVLEELASFAGDFVVATAGPDLESVLAAKGAGAEAYSRQTGKTVLHMDIGGGTSNLALIRDGKILKTGCLNVGGRLVKLESDGRISYISPVLEGLWKGHVGDRADREALRQVAQILVQALEMAAGLREATELLDRLWTKESGESWTAEGEAPVISFSGGVADCIDREVPWLEYGDMGPVLGRVIRESRLCATEYVLGSETIRATVIGAGCHSAQLSGSTVFYRNVDFPLKNVPVAELSEDLPQKRILWETTPVLTLPGPEEPTYERVQSLAERIGSLCPTGPVYLCLEQDMAKALGQALAVRMEPDRSILCIDRVRLGEGSYLDVGAPVGPALPVVVKTLVLNPAPGR